MKKIEPTTGIGRGFEVTINSSSCTKTSVTLDINDVRMDKKCSEISDS